MLCQFQIYSKVKSVIHISTLLQILFPYRPSQSIEQSYLCYMVGLYQSSFLYIAIFFKLVSALTSMSHLYMKWKRTRKLRMMVCFYIMGVLQASCHVIDVMWELQEVTGHAFTPTTRKLKSWCSNYKSFQPTLSNQPESLLSSSSFEMPYQNRQLVCVCVLSRVRLFATPWTVALQASLSMEFSRQEYWSELFPPPGDLPWIKPKSLHCRQILYHYTIGIPTISAVSYQSLTMTQSQ